MKPLQKLYYIS